MSAAVLNNTQDDVEEVASAYRSKPVKICFVCTGNTCRSPMAAAVVNSRSRETGMYAVSAGLCANEGEPISANAVSALEAAGILSEGDNRYKLHTARQITKETVESCDLVIGITVRHAMALIGAFPEYAKRITAMQSDISDPFGGTVDDYKRCLADIQKALEGTFI